MPKTSIYTLSRELGVSPATVSRALNMHPGISAEVRKKVKLAAEKHQFRPRFVSTRPTSIYVLIQQYKGHPLDFSSFTARTLEGVAEYCHDEGLEIGIYSSDAETLNKCDVVRELSKRGANAAVVLRATDESEFIGQMEKQKFPYCCILDGLDYGNHRLRLDNAKLTELAVEHLISLGHRRIGFITDRLERATRKNRFDGYRNALAKAGLEFSERLFFSQNKLRCSFHGCLEVGARGIEYLLKSAPDMTAVFTNDDAIATGVLCRLYQDRISVPERISVVGFDDYPESAYLCPPLTTVRIPYQRIGYEGARYAHRQYNGLEPMTTADFGGELIVRQSTGPVPEGKKAP